MEKAKQRFAMEWLFWLNSEMYGSSFSLRHEVEYHVSGEDDHWWVCTLVLDGKKFTDRGYTQGEAVLKAREKFTNSDNCKFEQHRTKQESNC